MSDGYVLLAGLHDGLTVQMHNNHGVVRMTIKIEHIPECLEALVDVYREARRETRAVPERLCEIMLQAAARIRELEEHLEKAKEVLRFYADRENYRNHPREPHKPVAIRGGKREDLDAPPGTMLSQVQLDYFGDRARAFLEGKE